MTASSKKLRDFYDHKPGAKIYQTEFGFFATEEWKKQGYIDDNTDLAKLFGFDEDSVVYLNQLGWCDPQLYPMFEEEILEDRGEYELVRDYAGRSVLFFKGRRDGFMPEYVDHPVKDMKTWEENIAWRLNPKTPERYTDLEQRMAAVNERVKDGAIVSQNIVGGYMYLRSLIGPEDLLYMFYDQPELIHTCMRAWLELADTVTAAHQKYVTFDEVYLGEDICYNSGSLISPDMMREFLLPYYQQLIDNIRRRQKDNRKLHIEIDTDGRCTDVIDIYKSIGADYMSPFEVASGCDVVEVRKKYPDLLIRGGFDKRIMAAGKDAIDREIERIMPFMTEKGGYIPSCDHGVPCEVSFENYMHYRKRMLEF
ncbi:MAG: uroporphyrinogen decarboxylase family protein [Acutalibacteraceae bacterium]